MAHRSGINHKGMRDIFILHIIIITCLRDYHAHSNERAWKYKCACSTIYRWARKTHTRIASARTRLAITNEPHVLVCRLLFVLYDDPTHGQLDTEQRYTRVLHTWTDHSASWETKTKLFRRIKINYAPTAPKYISDVETDGGFACDTIQGESLHFEWLPHMVGAKRANTVT